MPAAGMGQVDEVKWTGAVVAGGPPGAEVARRLAGSQHALAAPPDRCPSTARPGCRGCSASRWAGNPAEADGDVGALQPRPTDRGSGQAGSGRASVWPASARLVGRGLAPAPV